MGKVKIFASAQGRSVFDYEARMEPTCTVLLIEDDERLCPHVLHSCAGLG
jgi:hypothetical protein